jgi:hypothetical protein
MHRRDDDAELRSLATHGNAGVESVQIC